MSKEDKPFREKIIIKNFGPIKDVELEIKGVNILIGESGVGKSFIAKLIYIFHSFYRDITKDILIHENITEFNIFKEKFTGSLKTTFIKAFIHLKSFDNFNIIFFYDKEKSIELKLNKNNEIIIILSNSLIKNLHEVFEKYLDVRESQIDAEKKSPESNRFFFTTFPIMHYFDKTQSLYIPDSRSSIYLIVKNFFTLGGSISDYFFSEFGRIYEKSQDHLNRHIYNYEKNEKVDEFLLNSWKILEVEYIWYPQRDKEIFRLENGKEIELDLLSSGQKELLPAIITLYRRFFKRDNFIIFEEPEAHIFPTTQKELMELLVYFNNSGKNNKLFITTHSPYILTSLDNLIQAGNTAKAKPELKEEIEKIISSEKWVDFDDVGVYHVEDGRIHSIMNEENRSIDENKIDDVSEAIGEEFDKLLDLTYGE